MAKVQLEFEGTGGLLDDLRAIGAGLREVGTQNAQVQSEIQVELRKSAAGALAFGKATEDASRLVIGLGKAVGAEGMSRSIDRATASTEALGEQMEAVERVAGRAGKAVEKSGQSSVKAAGQSSAAIKSMGRDVLATNQRIGESVKLTAEQYAIIREELRAAGIEGEQLEQVIAEAVQELAAAGVEASDLSPAIEPAVDSVEGLQQQLRIAKKEAGALAAQFGIDSKEAIAAQRRVAELTDEVGDLTDRFEAFNPDRKFEALNQVMFSLQGGLFAVQSLVQNFAGDNEGLNKFISGFTSLLFTFQGLQTFVGGLGDSLKTLRATLGLTTAAQNAQTAAATAGAAATAATGTAAATASGSLGVLAGAFRTLTTVIATNPIGAIAVAILAVVGAISLLADEAEDATERIDGLFDRLKLIDAQSKRTADNIRIMVDAQNELDAISQDDTPQRQREAVLRAQRREIDLINEDVNKARIRQEELFKARESLDPLGENFEANRDRLVDAIEEQTAIIEEAGTRRLAAEARTGVEISKINAQERKDAIETAKQRREVALALAAELLASEKALSAKLREARAALGDGRDRVELDRQVAQEEVDELERGFKVKLGLVELQKRLSAKAYQELSDVEREARALSLVEKGDVKLPARQQEEINNLRLLAEEKYLNDLDALYREEAKVRAELIADSGERERELFIIGLEERKEALLKAGADEIEVRRMMKAELERFDQEAALKAIAVDQQIQEARIASQQRGAETELQFERRKELELLAVREAAARASLARIKDDGSQEAALLRAQFEQVITETQQAREKLLANKVQVSLLDLLGIRPEDQQRVKDALNQGLQSVIQIASTITQAQQDEVRERIAATDAIIADRRRLVDSLEDQLDEELELQKQGLANNADAVREEIKLRKEQEQQAINDKKKALEESKRLAKQQIAIDAASQIASLITSGANLIKTWSSLPYGVGIALAFAQIAAMVAAFASVRARINAVNRQTATFRKGGRLGGLLEGGSHEQGGIAMIDRRTGQEVGEAEGREFIVSTKAYAKRRRMVEAINDDDTATLAQEAVNELLRSAGIRVKRPEVERLQRMRAAVASSAHDASTWSRDELLEEVRGMREELAAFRQQERDRERVSTASGRITTATPGHKRIER